MLFVYSGQKTAVLILGRETCQKHLSHEHPGVGTAFLFSDERGPLIATVKLAPEIFRELNILVRTKAKYVLSVFDQMEKEQH